MDISAEKVKELRDRCGLGMMECKKALRESGGDIEEAIVILRKKGFARAERKVTRETAEGLIGSYIHMNGKIGVLVEVNCETDFVARNAEFQEMVKNIAMHIAASSPRYVSPVEIPQEVLDQEKEIIAAQFKDSNKPPEIIEKIVMGKLNKFYEEVCLLDQKYVKEDKLSIKEYMATFIAKFGENIRVKRFVRFQLGDS